MATTPGGNYYIESSDLVANYPATSLAIANRLDKYAVNPFTDAAARDAAIPTPVQGQLAQTLDDNKVWRYDGTAWAPFSGAVGAANFTDTATGTYSDGGINYKFITYTGTGSITIDQAGLADILIVAGGGAGGSAYGSGGGAGAFVNISEGFLSVATHTIVVGAGGNGRSVPYAGSSQNGDNGNASRIADYLSPGGGGGVGAAFNTASVYYVQPGLSGGSGGGASGMNAGGGATGGTGVVGFGGDGGAATSGITGTGAGGGGANLSVLGRGETPPLANYGGAGGAGTTSTIRNTVVDMCGGGGGSGGAAGGAGGSGIGGVGGNNLSGGAGTVSTGSGGGGSYTASANSIGGNGGSGIVIVRVVV